MYTHKLEQPLPGTQPAYLANGLIGLRVPPIPLPQGTALVNGDVGLSPEKETEEYADAVSLPEGWDAIEVERLWARGKPWRLAARYGAAKASLESLA